MTVIQLLRSAGRGIAYCAGLMAGGYAAYVSTAWLRYGHVQPPVGDDRDPLIDRFMPTYEIVERHHVRVVAPADITFAAARDVDLQQSPIIGAIFRARERILGSRADETERPPGLLRWAQTLGWRVLAEQPEREVVLGAVTRPWDANVVFRPVAPEEFARFDEPNYVKIVWTLRADPSGERESVVRTETRAVATDPIARAKFRRYWSIFSPGIIVIRRAALNLVKADAERRVRECSPKSTDRFDLVSAGDLDPQC
ncbi:MAG TPA: hypothetical protein VGQ16_18395 [Vicinamibacterales bacterium]|nr:hypothetical protein [Vicinamibacterales bacterium]